MYRVVVTDYLRPPATIEQTELEGLAEVECAQATSEEQLVGRVESADALIVFHDVNITAVTIGRLASCRVIVRAGVGFDNVDGRAAAAKGIVVCNVPDYGVDEVADHAVGLLLAVVRKIALVDRRLRDEPRPWSYLAVEPVFRLSQATVGIVGLGRIGTATALRVQALRCRVIACDPYIPDGAGKAVGVEMVELPELLARSDIVSLHCPLTDETRGMIGRDELAAMKPSAVIINTARGAIIDEHALVEALRAGTIAGAGIDVLPDEPPAEDRPIIRLWRERAQPPVNLVITPHCAFYSQASLVEMRTKAAREVARVLRGRPPRNPVNREFFVT